MRVSGIISCPSKNYQNIINPLVRPNFSLTLPENLTYDVVLDQSSSCTGVAIISVDNSLRILLEFARSGDSKDVFYRGLRAQLMKIVQGRKLRFFVCEEPVPAKGKQYASKTLIELRGRVAEWREDIYELSTAKFDSIYPQSWKSVVVDKKKGTNRSNDKVCIAEDICDIFPEYKMYFRFGFNKDYDGFDATGILLGYRKLAYSEDGVEKIWSKQEKRHASFVWYRYVPIELIDSGNLNDAFGKHVDELKPKFKMYNELYNKFNNIRMASSSSEKCTFTMLPEKELDVLKWKFDLERKDGYVLLMYVINESRFSRAWVPALKECFPMYEEVRDVC